MSRLRLNDRTPGAKIETFCLPTGSMFFIMRIASPSADVGPRLFLRCDENGDVFAAMSKAGTLAENVGE
jgi:hypothetical protein